MFLEMNCDGPKQSANPPLNSIPCIKNVLVKKQEDHQNNVLPIMKSVLKPSRRPATIDLTQFESDEESVLNQRHNTTINCFFVAKKLDLPFPSNAPHPFL